VRSQKKPGTWTATALNTGWESKRGLIANTSRTARWKFVLNHWTKFGAPCFRMYVVVEGQRHFLIERDQATLEQLAAFISSYTTWPIKEPVDRT
jgi:hypothetical protein